MLRYVILVYQIDSNTSYLGGLDIQDAKRVKKLSEAFVWPAKNDAQRYMNYYIRTPSAEDIINYEVIPYSVAIDKIIDYKYLTNG